jgi:uncharacterized LabA/DUF88 family protein
MVEDRVMVFIDGENLVMRYQNMVKEGWLHNENVKHKKDIFVWNPKIDWLSNCKILRFYYYTSAVGDNNKILALNNEIKILGFENDHRRNCRPNAGKLYSKVFIKEHKTRKTKGVDIQLTVDILSNVYQNNVDLVYLMSGDGDYVPVIEECIRMGKRVFLLAFSSGLNEKLKQTADEFILLDKKFFASKR